MTRTAVINKVLSVEDSREAPKARAYFIDAWVQTVIIYALFFSSTHESKCKTVEFLSIRRHVIDAIEKQFSHVITPWKHGIQISGLA